MTLDELADKHIEELHKLPLNEASSIADALAAVSKIFDHYQPSKEIVLVFIKMITEVNELSQS